MTKLALWVVVGWVTSGEILTQNGFSIHGSTTSVEKLTLLKKSEIQPS
jgi:hypothetical protein